MGRNKIIIEYIRDDRKRHVTLNKRKAGLIKKAYELSVLCGCEIGMVIMDDKGNSFLYGSDDASEAFRKQLSKQDVPLEDLDNTDVRRKIDGVTSDGESADEDDDEVHQVPTTNSTTATATPKQKSTAKSTRASSGKTASSRASKRRSMSSKAASRKPTKSTPSASARKSKSRRAKSQSMARIQQVVQNQLKGDEDGDDEEEDDDGENENLNNSVVDGTSTIDDDEDVQSRHSSRFDSTSDDDDDLGKNGAVRSDSSNYFSTPRSTTQDSMKRKYLYPHDDIHTIATAEIDDNEFKQHPTNNDILVPQMFAKTNDHNGSNKNNTNSKRRKANVKNLRVLTPISLGSSETPLPSGVQRRVSTSANNDDNHQSRVFQPSSSGGERPMLTTDQLNVWLCSPPLKNVEHQPSQQQQQQQQQQQLNFSDQFGQLPRGLSSPSVKRRISLPSDSMTGFVGLDGLSTPTSLISTGILDWKV